MNWMLLLISLAITVIINFVWSKYPIAGMTTGLFIVITATIVTLIAYILSKIHTKLKGTSTDFVVIFLLAGLVSAFLAALLIGG